MKWEYKGNKLAPPQTIARRLIAWPFLQFARCLIFIIVLGGWGLYEAKEAWNKLE